MKKRWKKPAVAAAVIHTAFNLLCTMLLFPAAGLLERAVLRLLPGEDGEKGTEPTAAPAEDDYFATARLSRKQARDNAISMLKEAERDENAQQSVLLLKDNKYKPTTNY